MKSRIPFSGGVGKPKTKVQVRIPFSNVVGKRLALRYTHSNNPVSGLQTNSRSLWFLERPKEKEKTDTFRISTIGLYIALKT